MQRDSDENPLRSAMVTVGIAQEKIKLLLAELGLEEGATVTNHVDALEKAVELTGDLSDFLKSYSEDPE